MTTSFIQVFSWSPIAVGTGVIKVVQLSGASFEGTYISRERPAFAFPETAVLFPPQFKFPWYLRDNTSYVQAATGNPGGAGDLQRCKETDSSGGAGAFPSGPLTGHDLDVLASMGPFLATIDHGMIEEEARMRLKTTLAAYEHRDYAFARVMLACFFALSRNFLDSTQRTQLTVLAMKLPFDVIQIPWNEIWKWGMTLIADYSMGDTRDEMMIGKPQRNLERSLARLYLDFSLAWKSLKKCPSVTGTEGFKRRFNALPQPSRSLLGVFFDDVISKAVAAKRSEEAPSGIRSGPVTRVVISDPDMERRFKEVESLADRDLRDDPSVLKIIAKARNDFERGNGRRARDSLFRVFEKARSESADNLVTLLDDLIGRIKI